MSITKPLKSIYDERFYNLQEQISLASSKKMVPFIVEILRPKSVLDVGCGLGTWLSTFVECGVVDHLGLDGPWVDQARLLIDKKNFIRCDLSKLDDVSIGRKFDLAISLEVAEHISKTNAEDFVRFIIERSDAVVFSAAVPFQDGDFHVNEQWPEYWKSIFNKFNFELVDIFRARFWDDPSVAYYYSQNCFLFLKNTKTLSVNQVVGMPLKCVHPKRYLELATFKYVTTVELIRIIRERLYSKVQKLPARLKRLLKRMR